VAEGQINFIAKAEGFPDAPIVQPGHETQPFGGLSINRPEVHGHLKEMYEEVISVCSFSPSLSPADLAEIRHVLVRRNSLDTM
jgi:hypothetical protein